MLEVGDRSLIYRGAMGDTKMYTGSGPSTTPTTLEERIPKEMKRRVGGCCRGTRKHPEED